MDQRQEKILETIVKGYVKTSKPISSNFLSKRLDLSSATIRNEMKELEKKKYLLKPHTSAGRIPTEKAYKFFITLLNFNETEIEPKISKFKKDPDDIFKEITRTLADMSGQFAFSGIKELKSFYQFGFSNLLKEEDRDCFSDMSKMMQEFEDNFDELFNEVSMNETRVFIGKENPLQKTEKLTLIISGCKIHKKKHGVFGILGPTRMRYEYNISLINKLRELIEQDYE